MATRKAMPVTKRTVVTKPAKAGMIGKTPTISESMKNKIKFGINMAKTAQPVIKKRILKSLPKVPKTSKNTGSFPKTPSPIIKSIPKSLPKTPKTSPNTGSFPKPINKKINMPAIGKSKMKY